MEMGNYSRNTFDAGKNYVAVRLQQGVPVVDADWNEMNDVLRHELYAGLDLVCERSGTAPGSDDYEVISQTHNPDMPHVDNDFYVRPGLALLCGRIVRSCNTIRYSTQPWVDSTRAARDGVDPIPALTTPSQDQPYIVYLDTWEREVGPGEDGDLINPAIGVETCVRLKRDVAVRVEEGTDLPIASEGHHFMPLALLHRPAGADLIEPEHVEDIRPFLFNTPEARWASFVPAFQPLSRFLGEAYDPWLLSFSPTSTGLQPPSKGNPSPTHDLEFFPKFFAYKPEDTNVYGLLPLTLPDGVQMEQLRIQGWRGSVSFRFLRIRHISTLTDDDGYEELVSYVYEPDDYPGTAGYLPFDLSLNIPTDDQMNIVDNSQYYYALLARALSGYIAQVHGISVRYRY
jgi:hypothetical protein